MKILYILTQGCFWKRFLKIAFFPALFLLLALPQMNSKAPPTFFQTIRTLIWSNSWFTLSALGGLILLTLWGVLEIDYGQWKGAQDMRFDTRALVKSANGGNGLATGVLDYKWFLGIVTTIYVKPKEYCAVVDGIHVIRRKRRYFKRPFERVDIQHVLLYPDPRLNISVSKIRSQDEWEISLSVSVDYEVAKPTEVTARGNRIAVLDERIKDALIDYISQNKASVFRGGQAEAKKAVLQALRESDALRMFRIREILKAQATESRQPLHPGYNRDKAILQDELARIESRRVEEEKQADHARQVELKKVDMIAAFAKTLTDSMTAAGVHGGHNPEHFARSIVSALTEIAGTLGEPTSVTRMPPLLEQSTASRQKMEEDSLNALQDLKLPIQDYQITSRRGQIRDAVVVFQDFQIRLTCPDGYPRTPPKVVLLTSEKTIPVADIQWDERFCLAHAIASVYFQAPTLLDREG